MSLTVFSKNKMLDHLTTYQTLYITALTSSDTADEVLTGRKVVSFSSAASGSVVGASAEDIVISAGTTVTHLAVFDEVTGGDALGVFSLQNPETFTNEGSLSVTGLTITLT